MDDFSDEDEDVMDMTGASDDEVFGWIEKAFKADVTAVNAKNIYKYFGTLATVGFSILVLFKEAISAAFSLFSSFTGPLNPLIPAELLVTNLYGIMFLVGFKEMKKTGSFKRI